MGDEAHGEMVEHLERLASILKKPSAILLISAHWEADVPTITSGPEPPLIYDYYGFPPETYRITYPCPGEPALARRVGALLKAAGIPSRLDDGRGFDHGLFVPLKIMYPEADIPCVQLSLIKGLDPAAHIQMGAALSGLDHENLLIIGSGFSFHNMRSFFEVDTPQTRSMNEQFEAWLIDTCCDAGLSEAERAARLERWEQTPYARYCHPREEHLMPLLACYGVAQAPCDQCFELHIFHKKSSFYLW